MKSTNELTNYVQKFREGDKEVFNSIYQISYPYLYTCIIHVVKDEDAAQDMLQETYLEVCRNIGQLEKSENFLSWSAMIANRKCFAYLKKRNSEILMDEKELDEREILENAEEHEEFIPESLMENKDKQRMVREIIDSLPDMQRLCIIGFYYNELSLEEIASALEIPVNTVKSHLSRGRAKIKEAVVELDEKKGIRLYSLAPFMLLFLGTEAEACTVPDMPDRLMEELGKGKVETSGASSFRKVGGKLAAGKLYSIAAVVGIAAIAGTAFMVSSHRSGGDATDPQEETEIQQDLETQGTGSESQDTAALPQENQVQEEGEGIEKASLQELFVLDESYESHGNAYGGSIPVKKDGLWGAVNYDNELIVPCQYDGFYAAGDKLGNFVLYNSTGTEDAYDLFGFESNEYYLFDNLGNLLYQGEDEVRASGGMYITLGETDNEEALQLAYHQLDGTVLVSELCDFVAGRINGFYEGVSNLYSSYGTDIIVHMDGSNGLGPFEDDVVPRIGSVTSQGELSWSEDPYYYYWWEDINESIQRSLDFRASYEGGTITNGTEGIASFTGRPLLSTTNHGYYITGSDYIEPAYISVYSDDGDNIANIFYFALSVDDNGSLKYDLDIYNEENYYCGYYMDGVMFFNYGSHMVFGVDGKEILVDFARNTNIANEIGDLNISEVVIAVYDYISMADEKYWLVQSGDKWGYIDHDGNEMAMFEDAGNFVNGHALVLEDGKAWFIDEDFNKLEDMGTADSVSSMGELFAITIGDEVHIYQYSSGYED